MTFRFALALTVVLASCTSFPVDSRMSALDGGDATVTLCGGGRCGSGYLFYRATSGTSASQKIAIYVPRVDCERDACVKVQSFRKDGTPGWGAGVPKGEDYIMVSVGEISGEIEKLTEASDGEYLIKSAVYYSVPDKGEQVMIGDGHLRVKIMANGYEPLGCNDPEAAFVVEVSKKCAAVVSTGYRAALCGECEKWNL